MQEHLVNVPHCAPYAVEEVVLISKISEVAELIVPSFTTVELQLGLYGGGGGGGGGRWVGGYSIYS
jgi:hypothetical protein